MRLAPRAADRPIVVLGGFADPGLGGLAMEGVLRRYFPDAKIITVSFMFCTSFDQCRERVIDAVDRAASTSDAVQTSEVDVIGLSMGGVVGRYCAVSLPASATAPASQPAAAATRPSSRRLNVKRLFTISSPHIGAMEAERFPALLTMQENLMIGSDFLRQLVEAERRDGAAYELIPYVRLGDTVVGAKNAAPAGRTAWWVPNVPLQAAHVGAVTDPRIDADIIRRLRSEPSLTQSPAAKLPN